MDITDQQLDELVNEYDTLVRNNECPSEGAIIVKNIFKNQETHWQILSPWTLSLILILAVLTIAIIFRMARAHRRIPDLRQGGGSKDHTHAESHNALDGKE